MVFYGPVIFLGKEGSVPGLKNGCPSSCLFLKQT